MIQGHPTKKGTGIVIFGDYGDLANLYTTVHKIADRLNEYEDKYKHQLQILMDFAYEIRHAYQKKRLYEKLVYDFDNEVYYYGFQYLWTDMLFTLSALRYNAGFVPLDELDQANLYLLEHSTKKALFEFDPHGAEYIQHYIGQRINVQDILFFQVNGALDIEYLNQKPTVKRFRNIPTLINSYSIHTDKYKNLKTNLELKAKEFNCSILDIEYDNMPEIIW